MRPGQQALLREMWQGRVWSALPCVVVQDEPAQRMLYIPRGTVVKYAVDADGRELRLYAEDWALAEHLSGRPVLSFSWVTTNHAVLAMWDQAWTFIGWYINLETLLRRTAFGFDFVDHCLDVLIPPDRSTWTWKDEDELEEAVSRGLFTATDAEAFRREGRRAAERVLSGEPPFDRDWSAWRPDPSWPVPSFPEGWDAPDDA